MRTTQHMSITLRARAVENWLREQVVPACEALKNGPESGVGSMQLREKLAVEYRKGQ